GAGGTRHQEDAVRPFDDLLEALVVGVPETQVTNVQLNVAAVKNAHHDRLAVVGRQDADAQVEVFAADGHLDTAVLRAALLRNVDRGHDLDARQDRRQQTARRTVAFHQDAVDPVTHPDAIGERLDVDVAGPEADRFLNDEVDQLDHRRIAVIHAGPGGL